MKRDAIGSLLLEPPAALFGALSRLRLALYQKGLLKVEKAPLPTISVGNLAAGGTGKTPFVRWLASELLRKGRRPCILTRGYGRESTGTVVVSDGKGERAAVRDSGDEAQLLARALPKVPIVADANRIRGAAKAAELSLPADLFLLDDGFSHVRISREVDIVLVDATFPDAGGAFLPAGLLREPLASLSRADLIVITRTDQANPERARALCEEHARGIPIFHATTEVLGISDRSGLDVDPVNLHPGTLVAVSGVARPEAFQKTLRDLGIQPAEWLEFPDHAKYTPFRIGRIQKALEDSGATALVTTEKDAVKLEVALSVPIFSIGIQMPVVEQNFTAEVLARLSRQVS